MGEFEVVAEGLLDPRLLQTWQGDEKNNEESVTTNLAELGQERQQGLCCYLTTPPGSAQSQIDAEVARWL